MRIIPTLAAALLASALAAETATAATNPDASRICTSVFGVTHDSLRAIATRLHPELLARAKRDSSVVVGLVFDSDCRLTAHAIGRRPSDRLRTDTALAHLFPAAQLNGWILSGFYEVGSRGPGSPWIVWGIRKPQGDDTAA